VIPLPVVRTVLDNGLTVLVRSDRAAPVVAIVTRVNAGYFDESDEDAGISHVLEHMYFKGTPSRGVGEIARETKASGGYLNAHTIYDATSYEVVLPASRFARGLEVQADAFANSLIEAEELARELEVIVQEARRKLDTPSAMATESLYALLHDRHRFRRWRIGEEAGLRALTRDRIVAFYRNFYRPCNTILAIVGDVEADETLAEVQRRYGRLPDERVIRVPGEAEIGPPGFRFREFGGDVEQAQVALGWRTPGPLHDDTPALDLAAAILGDGRGSRLYQTIRERQLASHVGAMNYTPRDAGVFVIRTEGDAVRAAEAAGGVWATLQSLRETDVTGFEVMRAQRLFEARWLRRQETMEGQADVLADWEGLGDWKLALAYFDSFMSLTPQAVRAAVTRHLDPGQASVLVYRPASSMVFGGTAPETRARLDGLAGAAISEQRPVIAAYTPPVGGAAGTGRSRPTRQAQLERHVGDVAVFRAGSGLPILVRRRPGAPVVHLGLFTSGGAAAEPDTTAGIGTIMVRASVKGTATRNAEAIALDSELLGGSIGTGVSADGTGWTLSVPTPRYLEAIALLQDVVQHPRFPDGAIATEQSIALSQLAQLRDDMFRYPVRLASAAAYGSHPYGRALLGTEDSLRAVTPVQVRAWHRDNVLSSGAVLAAVGDVDEGALAQALADGFTSIQPTLRARQAAPAWPAALAVRAESREKAQSAMAIAFPAPHRSDPARYDVELLCGVASGLGGRFFEELREKRSLAYTVHAFAMERASAGMFVAYIATAPDREAEARDTLLRECERLRTEPVTADELMRAARYAVGTRAIARQSSAVVLGEIVNAWLLGEGLEELDEVESRINAVTARSIQAYAAAAFDPARRVEGVVRGTA